MDQLTPTGILSILETTKEQRSSFITALLDQLDSGNADPLKVHYQVKCIEKLLEQLTTVDEKKNKLAPLAIKYRKLVLEAAETYGQKKFQYHNSDIEIKEAGVKYDYSKCDDPELAEWYQKQTELSEKIKAREKLLQSVPAKGMDIVQESGEVAHVYPPSKSSSTTVQVTFK